MRPRFPRVAFPLANLLFVVALAGCAATASRASTSASRASASTPGNPTRSAWTLTNLVVDGVEAPATPAPWHAPTLQFRPQDGQVVGEAGCNSYNAAYTVDGNALHLGLLGQTLVPCPGSVMNEENAYLAALPHVKRFAVSAGGDTLTLSSDDRSVRLTFSRA